MKRAAIILSLFAVIKASAAPLEVNGYIEATNYIKATNAYIEAATRLKAGTFVEAGSYITAMTYGNFGTTLTAAGNITSTNGRIYAGTYLQAADYIQTGTYVQSPIFKTPGNTASGTLSVALGAGTTSTTYGAVVIGRNNLEKQKDGTTTPPSGSATAWNDNDPLFVVGNGKGPAEPVIADRYRNAFTIYKDGTITMSKAQGDILMGQFGN